MALSLMVVGWFSNLSKCSAHLSRTSFSLVMRVDPSALRSAVDPDEVAPQISFQTTSSRNSCQNIFIGLIAEQGVMHLTQL